MGEELNLEKITPEKWLDNKYKFKVPVYQRLFTWDTPQFDRLLSDLQDWNKKHNGKPYYLGIITVVEQQDNSSHILIDGQQRLTVIAILMGMFKKHPENDDCSIEDYLDYEARPNDRMALESIWKNGSEWLNSMNIDELNKKMDDCQIVSDSMRSFIRHIKKNETEWGGIIENLFKRITLLVSCLPKSYKESLELQNEYFEKMNSAGKQLEPHEILKVRICEKEIEHAQWNGIEDFTRKFNNTSNEIHFETYSLSDVLKGSRIDEKSIRVMADIITFPDEKKRKSVEKWRPSLVAFPMFLFHVLKVINIGFRIPKDSHTLLKCFEGKNTLGFVSSMCKYRKFLDEWIIHKDIDAVQVVEKEDDISDFSYWKGENQVKTIDISSDEKETCRKLKQIQMALYAIGDPRQEWMVFAYRLFNKKQKEGQIPPNKMAEYLLIFLVRYLIKKAAFEKDILLNEEWQDEYLTYNNNTHAHFICLDYFLWLLANSSDKDKELREEVFDKGIPEAVKSFVPSPHRSVEHFHPRTDTNSQNVQAWSKPLPLRKEQDFKDIFGNLALISAGHNSEYGNQTIAAKSERIEKLIQRKELESIKLFLMMHECDKSESNWTPDRAHRHANKMLKVLKWGLAYYGITHSVKN